MMNDWKDLEKNRLAKEEKKSGFVEKLLKNMQKKRHYDQWCPRCAKDVEVFSNGGFEPLDLKDQDCPSCGLERVKRVCEEYDEVYSGWPVEYDNVVNFEWERQMKFEDDFWDEYEY